MIAPHLGGGAPAETPSVSVQAAWSKSWMRCRSLLPGNYPDKAGEILQRRHPTLAEALKGADMMAEEAGDAFVAGRASWGTFECALQRWEALQGEAIVFLTRPAADNVTDFRCSCGRTDWIASFVSDEGVRTCLRCREGADR